MVVRVGWRDGEEGRGGEIVRVVRVEWRDGEGGVVSLE